MFSHASKVDLVHAAVDDGYDVVLHVILIPEGLCRPRVAVRARAGGHDVPVDKLAARDARLWPLVASVVPRCHRAGFYDNSRDDGPVEAAAFRSGIADYVPRWAEWTPEALTRL